MKLTSTVLFSALVLSSTAALACNDDASSPAGDASAAGSTAMGVASDANAVTGTPPSIFKHGTLGLSAGIPTSSSDGQINIAYFKDQHTAYDLFFGFDLAHTPDTTTPGTMGMPAMTTPGGTTFGVSAGVGYRMYKRNSQRIHTYLEPFAEVASADLGSVSDNLMLGVGGALGAECMFTDWFSVRGQVGVALTVGSTFKAVQLATSTSGLYANFYWD